MKHIATYKNLVQIFM